MCNKLYLSTTALLLLALPYVSVAQSRSSRGVLEEIPSANRFNFFDLELLQAVANSHSGNVLVSPLSIKAVLAMILEGAGGESGEQIRTALRLPENQSAIQRVFQRFLSSLMEQSPGIKLEIASRVFMAKPLSANPDYATSLRSYYFSDLVKVDFNNPESTARIINDWVKQFTKGLIPKLVDAANLSPNTQTVLANAVYFKGRWKIPFDQETTSVKCFYTAPGACHSTNMMETLEFFNYNYIQELDADALEIPYQGDKFSMIILAPKEVDGMTQLKRDIVHVPLNQIIASLEPTEVLVSLPRFEIDFSTDVVPTLHRLGIKDIFGPNSNLTGLFARSEVSAQVSNIFHKAKIIVNEAGSEAAAGTGALVIPLMGSAISKFRADRPFLFFIQDKTSGITLFSGRVSVPEAANPQYQRPKPPSSTPTAIEIDDLQQSIFTTEKYVPTLRPSNSNSGSGQSYRPSAITTRRPPNRPALQHGQTRPPVTTTSSTEGREINSYLSQKLPTNSHNSQHTSMSNVHYPSTSEEKVVLYKSSAQNTNSQNSYPQYEGSTQNFNSPNPATSTNSNPQNSYTFQNLNRPQQTFPQAIYPQQNSQNIPLKHTPQSVLEFSRSSAVYQNPSDTQFNSQNQASSYTPNSQNSNTQYTPNYQNTEKQSSVREYQNPPFARDIQNSGFKSQNLFTVKSTYNRETQQHSNTQNTKQLSNVPFQPAPLPLYIPYHIPGNTGEYLTNTRESHQASSQQSPTYTVVVKNEAAGSQPVYQQPQSQDRDAIQFSSRVTT